MATIKKYSVPAQIAEDLGLTRYRQKDSAGNYLLSGSDLRSYGIPRALSAGGREIGRSESTKEFKKQ
jgi:hypothetical protein